MCQGDIPQSYGDHRATKKENNGEKMSIKQRTGDSDSLRHVFFSVSSATPWFMVLAAVLSLTSRAAAQAFSEDDFGNGPKPAKQSSVERWKIGLVVTAKSEPCAG